MSVYSYSKTVASNTTVGGQTVTDGVMVPSAVDNAFQGVAAEIAEYRDDTGGALATTGSSNAYVLATNATAVLADGASVSFVANFANTGAATINVDSLGAKAIRKENDQAVVTGDILANGHYIVQYDASANSAAGAWLLINSSGYADASHTHTLSDVTDSGALAALDTVGTSEIDANAVTLTELEDGTQGDILYYGASGAPARLGAGTSGQFLKTQGAGANPVWAGSGGTAFLDSKDASSSASLDFTAFDGSTYDAYVFYLQNVIPATDDVELRIRLSNDAGSTYESGAAYYNWSLTRSRDGDAPSRQSDTSDSEIQLNDPATNYGVGSAAGEDGWSGKVTVYNPALTKKTMITFEGAYIGDGGDLVTVTGVGLNNTAEANDALQFLFSSGNIESGTITMVGIKNA